MIKDGGTTLGSEICLKSRGHWIYTLRNVISCLHDFETKEKIMTKARTLHTIDYEGTSLQLYTDLSQMTLQKRCHLKPLVSMLGALQQCKRQGFPLPFALSCRLNHLTSRQNCLLLHHQSGSQFITSRGDLLHWDLPNRHLANARLLAPEGLWELKSFSPPNSF